MLTLKSNKSNSLQEVVKIAKMLMEWRMLKEPPLIPRTYISWSYIIDLTDGH